jgi:transposase-like protein
MRGKRFTAEQIILTLRQAEVEIAEGKPVHEACKQIGVTEQTFYPWRKVYGGLKLDQAKEFKQLGRENAGLRKLVADLTGYLAAGHHEVCTAGSTFIPSTANPAT